MKLRAMLVIGSVALGLFALLIVLIVNEYIYSVEEYAFKPLEPQPQEGGIEHYAADIAGGKYTGKDGSVPVFFCKYGNMVAVNVVGFEKPWLWKTGNKVVVLTGDEGDLPHKAHSECLIVVMDADEGEMLVARPTADDIKAIGSMRRVEVEDHVVHCYNVDGACHDIRVKVKHRLTALSRFKNRRAIFAAAKRGRPRRDYGRKWVDPKSGLEWSYVDTYDGVEIYNKRTGGTAVSPMPTCTLAFPAYIEGKPVKSIGASVIVNCFIETVRIPRTVERFSECAAYSLFNHNLKAVEVENGSAKFSSKDGLLYDSSGTVLLFVPRGLSEVSVPTDVMCISDMAFKNCERIRRVVIPSNVRELGRWAFSHSGITEVFFKGDAPKVPTDELWGIYTMTPTALTTHARKDAKGWRVNDLLPTTWCGRPIVFE